MFFGSVSTSFFFLVFDKRPVLSRNFEIADINIGGV